jgi:hypothetical protein
MTTEPGKEQEKTEITEKISVASHRGSSVDSPGSKSKEETKRSPSVSSVFSCSFRLNLEKNRRTRR